MEYLQYTDFRNHAKQYLDKIEAGTSYIIIRQGRPVARITPFVQKPQGWKRPRSRVRLGNTSSTTLDFLVAERAE